MNSKIKKLSILFLFAFLVFVGVFQFQWRLFPLVDDYSSASQVFHRASQVVGKTEYQKENNRKAKSVGAVSLAREKVRLDRKEDFIKVRVSVIDYISCAPVAGAGIRFRYTGDRVQKNGVFFGFKRHLGPWRSLFAGRDGKGVILARKWKTFQVYAWKDHGGYSLKKVVWVGEKGKEIVLKVFPLGLVEGLVCDYRGIAIPSAVVRVWPSGIIKYHSEFPFWEMKINAKTGPFGRFKIFVPICSHLLIRAITKDGEYKTGFTKIFIPRYFKKIQVKLVLKGPYSIRGKVVGYDGIPLPDVAVYADEVVSDPQKYFDRISLSTGSKKGGEFHFEMDRGGKFRVFGGGIRRPRSEPIFISLGKNHVHEENLLLRVPNSFPIRGKLVDQKGRGIPNASCWAVDLDGKTYSGGEVKTGKGGEFEFRVIKKGHHYKIGFQLEGTNTEFVGVGSENVTAGTSGLIARLPGSIIGAGKVIGKVELPGFPPPGKFVAELLELVGKKAWISVNFQDGYSGMFSMKGLVPGKKYRILIRMANGRVAESRPWVAEFNQVKKIKIVVRELSSLSYSVFSDLVEDFRSIEACLYREGEVTCFVPWKRLKKNGTIEWKIPPGSYKVVFRFAMTGKVVGSENVVVYPKQKIHQNFFF